MIVTTTQIIQIQALSPQRTLIIMMDFFATNINQQLIYLGKFNQCVFQPIPQIKCVLPSNAKLYLFLIDKK